MKIAAMVTKSRETTNSYQYFSILSYFLALGILYFFLNMDLYGHNSNMDLYGHSSNCRVEKNYGITALVQEILCKVSLKWASFARFPRGAWGEF